MNPLRSAVATTGWGVYCASSWTWCIGMFLPVILLQRYGWWGFLVFAVPNVIGCAAFGYVLRSRECSQDVVNRHTPAMQVFSLVTIAFHVFFIGFVLWLLLPVDQYKLWLALLTPTAMVFVALVLTDLPDRYWPWFAVAVYALSIGTFAVIGVEPLQNIAWQGEHPVIDAAWLVPVMLFGFLLCPYLDLTFHRALQQSPRRHAFAVFGITFTVMIILTCAYWDLLATGLTWLLLGHIAAQSVFTVSAHMREVRQILSLPLTDSRHYLILLSPLLALPLAFVGAFGLDAMSISLDNYLRFLVFYGLLFPAYAILFLGRRAALLTKRNVIVLALIVLAFAPLYEAGFLHGQAWALVVPPLVLLLWRARRSFGRLPELENGHVKSAG